MLGKIRHEARMRRDASSRAKFVRAVHNMEVPDGLLIPPDKTSPYRYPTSIQRGAVGIHLGGRRDKIGRRKIAFECSSPRADYVVDYFGPEDYEAFWPD